MEYKIVKKSIKKLTTTDGTRCKHYYRLLDGKFGLVLVIRKFILCEEDDIINLHGFVKCRRFKDKVLYFQSFSIKVDTLNDVVKWINEKL